MSNPLHVSVGLWATLITAGESGCSQPDAIPVSYTHLLYTNPLYGKTRPQIDFPILQDLYAKGDLILDKMVTRTYPLSDLPQAFADMHAGVNAKGVIVF